MGKEGEVDFDDGLLPDPEEEEVEYLSDDRVFQALTEDMHRMKSTNKLQKRDSFWYRRRWEKTEVQIQYSRLNGCRVKCFDHFQRHSIYK